LNIPGFVHPNGADMRTPQIVMMPVGELRPNNRNARTHSKKQIRQIANSIVRFGFTCPVVTDEHGNVIIGHGRLLAASDLKLKHVPVVVATGLSDVEKRALSR
jgi:ParB-like chromosome segregation protein Spo0J